MRFAPKIQSQDVRTRGTYTYGILKFSSSPYHFVQSIGALPGGSGRSGMARSKELDLCYNFHLCGFSILATRRSGNPASVGAPHMIHTQVDLTRVQGSFVRPKLFVRERYPNSFDSTSQNHKYSIYYFCAAVFVQLTVAPLLVIPLSAARKWDKEGR